MISVEVGQPLLMTRSNDRTQTFHLAMYITLNKSVEPYFRNLSKINCWVLSLKKFAFFIKENTEISLQECQLLLVKKVNIRPRI